MEEHQLHNLIIRYLSKETTPDEESELLDWIAKDPSNQYIFKEWQQVWKQSPVTEPTFNTHQGLERLNKAIIDSEATVTRRNWGRLAASIAVFFAVSFATYFVVKHSWPKSQIISYQERNTSWGERTTLTLEDGSMIILNANSSLRYPKKFSNINREVFLSGEAFFQVARDSRRPFIIHSADLITQVLGTSFNINTENDSIIVSVATGKVKVSNENVSTVIFPNEKIVYSTKEKKMDKTRANLDYDLAWKDNIIIFDDTPLSSAALMLQEFYGFTIVFEDGILKKCPVTGKFSNQTMETVLDAISFSTGIRYQIIGKEVRLSGAGCE